MWTRFCLPRGARGFLSRQHSDSPKFHAGIHLKCCEGDSLSSFPNECYRRQGFTIRSSGKILPKVWQPQAVHLASYESFGLCSTTSIVGSLQSGQKAGRISIATSEREPQYVDHFRS